MFAEDASTHPLVGQELGRYLIEAPLGSGGMGLVYRASDQQLPRSVALKVIKDAALDDKNARTQFLQEIAVAASIFHPNVIPVLDGGIEDGRFFFTMELVEGPDLSVLLESGPLEQARALRLAGHLCEALRHVHQRNVIHRDIKPQNVLIWEAGEDWEVAKLGDFGIARAVESVEGITRRPRGTPEYMPPEVATWQGASELSDQYSLACVVFEMLSGQRPYPGQDPDAGHVQAEIPLLHEVNPAITTAISSAVERAMAKNPEDRFPSVAEFAQALNAPAAGPPPSTSTQETPRGRGLIEELVEILDSQKWVAINDLAKQVNERGRYRPPSGPVSAEDIDRRTRLFPRRFRRRGREVRLR